MYWKKQHKQTYWRWREGAEVWWCCPSMITTTLHANWLRSWNCALEQSVKVSTVSTLCLLCSLKCWTCNRWNHFSFEQNTTEKYFVVIWLMTLCTSAGAKEPAASINRAEAHQIKRFYIQDYKTLLQYSTITTQVILHKHKYYPSHEYGQFPCQYHNTYQL